MYPPQPSLSSSSSQSLINGLTKLKDASSRMIIATALVGISLTLFLMSIIPILVSAPTGLRTSFSSLFTLFGLAPILAFILLISGAILALTAVYGKLIPSSKDLSNYDPELASAAMLIKIGYAWGFILAIVGVLTLAIVVGIVLIILALIFLIVGAIGLIIMLFKLNSSLKETMFIIAGVLFIIGMFLPIVDFIGWILVYVGANSILIRLRQPIYSGHIASGNVLKICPYCGSQIPAESKICPVCGLELPFTQKL